MSQKRLKSWQKATALVPLALLSGAWTASLAGSGTATAATPVAASLPDGTVIPDEAIEAPASVSLPGAISPSVPAGAADTVIANSTTNAIPSAALAAYQRAAQVINAADPSCKVPWQLLAGIGRVESDHGRYGGNVLNDEGKSTPGIFGIPLDGSNGTARITDTDAGQYDKDQLYDRAVGPMQFIPSTWSVVGVDADGDDVRDPQDIDDAALASAVYLCSGDEDLSTTAGQRTAVYRYNHSNEYVDLVLSITNAYISGDYTAVPTSTRAPTIFAPTPIDVAADEPPRDTKPTRDKTPDRKPATNNQPESGEETTPDSGGGDDTENTPGTGGQTPPLTGGGDDRPGEGVEDTVEDVTETVEDTITPLQEAIATCQATFSSAEIDAVGGLQVCGQKILEGGVSAVQNLLDGLLGTVGGLTGGLTGGGSGGGLLGGGN